MECYGMEHLMAFSGTENGSIANLPLGESINIGNRIHSIVWALP
jgi:hypothetical protein